VIGRFCVEKSAFNANETSLTNWDDPMQLEGRVEHGQIVLNDGLELPHGTVVRVEIVEPACTSPSLSLFERLQPIIGKVQDLPADASLQHDHYLYGTPKRPR